MMQRKTHAPKEVFHPLSAQWASTKFKAIKASLESSGLVPRKHQHHQPHHALHLSDVQYVITFIHNYTEDRAVLLPGRTPGHKRDDVILLPTSPMKRVICNLYLVATESTFEVKAVRCPSSFCSLWQQLLPPVVTKPMADLSWKCQQNSIMLMRAHNGPEAKG